jgi:hypothetical protein
MMDSGSEKRLGSAILVDRQEKKGLPAKLDIGDPLPAEIEVLPKPEVSMEDRCSVAAFPEGEEVELEETEAVAGSLGRKMTFRSAPGQPSAATLSTSLLDTELAAAVRPAEVLRQLLLSSLDLCNTATPGVRCSPVCGRRGNASGPRSRPSGLEPPPDCAPLPPTPGGRRLASATWGR